MRTLDDKPGQPDAVWPEVRLNAMNLRQQATREIRARIVAGRLQTDLLYSTSSVASSLGISATPIREALLDLAKEGLVEVVRNRGFRVVRATEKDLDEITELRRMVEVGAIRKIASAGAVSNAAELWSLCKDTGDRAAAADWIGFVESDRAFHLRLLSNAGNGRLVELVGRLRDQSRLYGLDRAAGSPKFLSSTREHDLLLDAIQRNDPAEAVRIMEQHLAHTRGVWAGRDEAPESTAGAADPLPRSSVTLPVP